MSKQEIVAAIDEIVCPLGFKRVRAVWNRENGNFIEAFDVQLSKSGDMLTVNAGVLSKSTFEIVWRENCHAQVGTPDCTVRARVGALINRFDRWWDVDDTLAPREISLSVESIILPFLLRVGTCSGMLDFLSQNGAPHHRQPLESLYYAVLMYESGDKAACCEVLSRLREKVLGNWKERFRETAARLKCGQVPI